MMRWRVALMMSTVLGMGCAELEPETGEEVASPLVSLQQEALPTPASLNLVTWAPAEIAPVASSELIDLRALDMVKKPVKRTVNLKAALGEEAFVVGITVEPDTDRVLVLDADQGIFEVLPSGRLNKLWDRSNLPENVEISGAFTDFVAVGNGLLALTAINDGYLLDLNTDGFVQHFCYLPDSMPGEFIQPELQITQAVAFDVDSDLLYAQPQSFIDETDLTPVQSLFSTYDLESGTDLMWASFPDPTFLAGGMVIEKSDTMIMAMGDTLFRYSISAWQLENIGSLARFGISDVQGLGLNKSLNTLLVLDGAQQKLVELDLDQIIR